MLQWQNGWSAVSFKLLKFFHWSLWNVLKVLWVFESLQREKNVKTSEESCERLEVSWKIKFDARCFCFTELCRKFIPPPFCRFDQQNCLYWTSNCLKTCYKTFCFNDLITKTISSTEKKLLAAKQREEMWNNWTIWCHEKKTFNSSVIDAFNYDFFPFLEIKRILWIFKC